MTEEEKLQEYLRQNAAPREKKEKKKPAPVVAPPNAMTPIGFYARKWWLWAIMSLFYSFFISAIIGTGLARWLNWTDAQIVNLYYIGIVVFSAFVLVKAAKWYYYLRWINNDDYVTQGWAEFLALRSPRYWKDSMFTSMKITIKLKPDATPVHQEAARLFLKNWPHKWGKLYSQIEWDVGYGKPNDFKPDGLSITGDVAARFLNRVIRALAYRFIPLAKLLGDKLEAVVITSSAKEVEIKNTRVRDDAYDRNN